MRSALPRLLGACVSVQMAAEAGAWRTTDRGVAREACAVELGGSGALMGCIAGVGGLPTSVQSAVGKASFLEGELLMKS